MGEVIPHGVGKLGAGDGYKRAFCLSHVRLVSPLRIDVFGVIHRCSSLDEVTALGEMTS